MKINTLSFRTYSAKPNEIEAKWRLVDANGKVLGKLATEIATILRGKDKPQFTPYTDTGDYVIVINAEKVAVTGAKREKKFYYHNTQYPGGARFERFDKLQKKFPERIIEKAVWGMLPKGNLGRAIYRKLKVYAGDVHPHQAQNPIPLELK